MKVKNIQINSNNLNFTKKVVRCLDEIEKATNIEEILNLKNNLIVDSIKNRNHLFEYNDEEPVGIVNDDYLVSFYLCK